MNSNTLISLVKEYIFLLFTYNKYITSYLLLRSFNYVLLLLLLIRKSPDPWNMEGGELNYIYIYMYIHILPHITRSSLLGSPCHVFSILLYHSQRLLVN